MALTACEGRSNQQPAPKTETKETERTLLIGVIPEQDIFKQNERYQPLADYLGQKIGHTVKLKILPRYGNIVANFVTDKLDGAFLGSFTFALLHKKLNVEPLARPVNLAGNSTYHGMIIVRKDSGIRSGQDMKGICFAFVEKATTAGYLLPLHYFKEQQIADYRTWFRESYFAGTHTDVINDVLTKRADAGAAKNTMLERLAKDNQQIADELLVLARSPEVPDNALAMRDDLDPLLKKQIKDTLLSMDSLPEGRVVLTRFEAQKFIETTDQDYHVIYQYADDVGLDLANYEYQNE